MAECAWGPRMIRDSFARAMLDAGRQRIARQRAAKMAGPIRAEIRYTGEASGFVLVHRSTKRSGWWQATFFDGAGEPWMDTEGEDFAELVLRLWGYGVDWRTARPVGP